MTSTDSSASSASETVVSNDDSSKEKKDVVDYASFQKAVAQKKAVQARAEAAEAKLKELDDKLNALENAKLSEQDLKLKAAGEWQKVIESRDAQINELKNKYDETLGKYEQTNKTLDDAVKLNAVYSKLPGKLKNPKYAGFIELEKIAINPETGDVDSSTVDDVVNSFCKEHRELLDTKNFKGLPGDAARSSQILTVDAFRQRPLAEMKKSLPEAVRAEKLRLGIKTK